MIQNWLDFERDFRWFLFLREEYENCENPTQKKIRKVGLRRFLEKMKKLYPQELPRLMVYSYERND